MIDSIKDRFIRLNRRVVRRLSRLTIVSKFLTIRIKLNHRSILKLSNSTQNISLITRKNVEHYYHFVFDLLLPLSLLVKRTSSNIVFSHEEFGILTPLLLTIFKDRVIIQSNFDELSEGKKVRLHRMEPRLNNIHDFPFENLKERVFQEFNILPAKAPNKILLIERLPPDTYYENNGSGKGSGSSRRAIKNHEELEKYIGSVVSQSYEFHNLKLENMAFEDQVRYFDSAVAVIAQHGAGLANILWMPKKSIVIELGFNSKEHFKNLSFSMNHHHLLFDYNKSHIEVNCVDFHSQLLKSEITRGLFSVESIT